MYLRRNICLRERQIDFLMPGFLYDYPKFAETFEAPITKHKDEIATAKLKNMFSPFILRRRKKDEELLALLQ